LKSQMMISFAAMIQCVLFYRCILRKESDYIPHDSAKLEDRDIFYTRVSSGYILHSCELGIYLTLV